MKSCTILLHLTQDMNNPFAQGTYYLPITDKINCHSSMAFMSQAALILLNNYPDEREQ
jgi:hypothetical protein